MRGKGVIHFTSLPVTTIAGLGTRECGPAAAPTICFLHGGGVGGWMWRPQVEVFQHDYHCLIPDLPEHGLSADTRPLTIVDAARRVAQLIAERAHGGRAHVVGVSLGAQIVVQLLSVDPKVVDHAFVSSASLHEVPSFGLLSPPSLALTYWLFLAPFKGNDGYIRLNMKGAAGLPDGYFQEFRASFRGMTAEAFVHTLTENQRFRLPAGLEHMQTPTLVTAGLHEYAIMRRSARELAATLPQGEGYLVSLSKRIAEEHGWNLYAPEIFNAVLRAWIVDHPLPVRPELQPLKDTQ